MHEVELWKGDLEEAGSYDAAFHGCGAVIHAGATVGYNKEKPQRVYDGCFTEVAHVLGSVRKAGGSVKRFVFTSSFAAVAHAAPHGYVFTEKDWCPHEPNVNAYGGKWTEADIPKNRDIAYAVAKARAEKLAYEMAAASGSFEAFGILPLHVIGPLMCANHDQPWSWQNCIRGMMNGQPYVKSSHGRMLWNLTDVRDVARAHRLCLERDVRNGSRYILAAGDRSGEMFTWQLQARLKQLYPGFAEVGGEEMEGSKPQKKTRDAPRSYCLLAKEELGLEPAPVEQTLRATVDSYIRLGLVGARSKL